MPLVPIAQPPSVVRQLRDGDLEYKRSCRSSVFSVCTVGGLPFSVPWRAVRQIDDDDNQSAVIIRCQKALTRRC